MNNSVPDLFVSYCRTSQSLEQWVRGLARELRFNGVRVTLHGWDPYHQSDAFSDDMVREFGTSKVVLICGGSSCAARLANPRTPLARHGGHMSQTDPLQSNTKFVAVLPELKEDEDMTVPLMFRSRSYIDLSDPKIYGRNFEQLLRWVTD